jgi:DNA-binding IclR family transcriptional regulator
LSAEEHILQLFAASPQPMRIRTLRQRAGLRHETVSLAVAALTDHGVIELTDHGYRLVDPAAN